MSIHKRVPEIILSFQSSNAVIQLGIDTEKLIVFGGFPWSI